MAYTSNIDAIIARMQGIPKRIEARVRRIVKIAVMMIDEGVHQKTPVYSGLAVRNMIWSKDTPNTVQFPEIKAGEIRSPQRRQANESAARNTRDALDFKNPYGVYFLSNASKHIRALEAGELSAKVPPGGMFGLTYKDVKSRLGTA